MKLPIAPALALVLAGCATTDPPLPNPANLFITNSPSEIRVTVTNSPTLPGLLSLRLDPGAETNLLRAIQQLASRSNAPVVVVVTNSHSVSVMPVITNELVLSEPLDVMLSRESLTNLSAMTGGSKENSPGLQKMLLGAVLTLTGGILTALVTRRALAKNVLIAMKNEEASVFKTYQENLQKELHKIQENDKKIKDGQVFNRKASLTVNWFPIFSANAGNIGLLKTAHMTALIETHAAMKSLIESYQLNNRLLDEAEKDNFKIEENGDVLSPPQKGHKDYRLYDRLIKRAEEIAESDKLYEDTRKAVANIKVPQFYL